MAALLPPALGLGARGLRRLRPARVPLPVLCSGRVPKRTRAYFEYSAPSGLPQCTTVRIFLRAKERMLRLRVSTDYM